MARLARIGLPGVAHHVTPRGNNRADVCVLDMDPYVYLHLLSAKCAAAGVSVRGYGLRGDPGHGIVMPAQAKRLARALSRTHWHYAPYVNHLPGCNGRRWQNRFHSRPLGPRHLHRAMRYVERNPVRAKLTTRAWDYAWSSARVQVGLAPARNSPTLIFGSDGPRGAAKTRSLSRPAWEGWPAV